ncbi:UDP-glycosyltransferase 79 [Frankliniella fusca]|uniref:UDP-glycosyltransferase 79 n=1 Tax=Frankliniella fusca TaxID=407009 RepID=A0AAE1LZ17_9NEOP|nr:UDP-glycosyltransferase 79 [Frankliniella fusca]
MTLTWKLLGGLLVVAVLAAAEPVHARMHASPLSSATSLAAPRDDPQKCLADLWWGLKDSGSLIIETTEGCIKEKLDTWYFLLDDMKQFGRRVATELQAAGKKCLQKPGGCLAELAKLARSELQPLADLVWRTVKALITIGFSATFELFGCIFLPAILPAVWQTLMDVLIFGECLIYKSN